MPWQVLKILFKTSGQSSSHPERLLTTYHFKADLFGTSTQVGIQGFYNPYEKPNPRNPVIGYIRCSKVVSDLNYGC